MLPMCQWSLPVALSVGFVEIEDLRKRISLVLSVGREPRLIPRCDCLQKRQQNPPKTEAKVPGHRVTGVKSFHMRW